VPPTGQGVQPTQYLGELPPPVLPPQPQPLPPTSAVTPFPVTEGIFPGASGLPTTQFTDPAVDVFVDLEETQTGRFLLGVGVNSDAGIVGQILLDERNFDWRRPPRSWQDVVDGTAWRGGGQRLRIEAAPGSEVQRYLINFQEPFLLGTPISLNLSGSYYDRRFNDWDEQRLGGRVGLGYQWVDSDVSTNLTYRGENVNISNPSNPAEPQLEDVLGDNTLHGFRLAVINDTRDSSFLATQGHYFEIYGEQVIGTFDYPRGGFDLRKYFLMRERADHSGRHVLSLTTKVDVSGSNTPIYDNFFAGGFSTMRGFDFRGASPVSNGVEVGGEFRWLNSVEYMFPLTADDMLHGVAFCDFGTTEPKVEINDFRVAPGVGLRVTVPAMGPAPIALDFAFPVSKADTDDEQVFSFSIGFLR
jgi:outer membrane protein insertion porin family